MKKSRLIVVGALSWAALVSGASATTFTGSYAETYNTGSPGLRIGTQTLQTDSLFSVSLALGEGTTVDLYQIYAPETTVNGDDVFAQNIATLFTFTAPEAVTSTVTGKTVGVKDTDAYAFSGYSGNHQYGQVSWDATEQVVFTDGSILDITLNDAVFNEGEYYALNHGSYPYSGTAESNGAPITATFTLEGATAPPVSSAPEPGTWALLLAGVALVGAALRLGGRREPAIARA